MALWGNKDNLQGPSPVTIVGTATSEFWTAAATGISTIPTGTTIGLGTRHLWFRCNKRVLVQHCKGQPPFFYTGTHPAFYTQQPISLKERSWLRSYLCNGELGRTQRPVAVDAASVSTGTVWEVGVSRLVLQPIWTTPPSSCNEVKEGNLVAASGIATW